MVGIAIMAVLALVMLFSGAWLLASANSAEAKSDMPVNERIIKIAIGVILVIGFVVGFGFVIVGVVRLVLG